MIGGILEHTGGPKLAKHLADGKKNQSIKVRTFGLIAEEIAGSIAELHRLTVGVRTARPLIHAYASPARPLTDEQWEGYWARFEVELGLDGFPHLEVIQEKLGCGRTATHRHRVYPRVRPDRSLVRLSHARPRQEKLSRICEWLTGEPLIKGRHNWAVAAALRAEGRSDIAQAMDLAGLLDGERPVAASPHERAMTERTESLAADAVWQLAYDAWRRTTGAEDLSHALSDVGLILAQGDRKPVVVAPGGAVHDLRRAVSNGAKHAGADRVRAADIKQRLDGFLLLTLDVAKSAAAASRPNPATLTGITRLETLLPTAMEAEAEQQSELLLNCGPIDPRPLEKAASAREVSRDLELTRAPLPELTPEQEHAKTAFLEALCGGAVAEVEASRPPPALRRPAAPQGSLSSRRKKVHVKPEVARSSQEAAPVAQIGLIAELNWRDAYKASLAGLPPDLGSLLAWVQRLENEARVIRLKSGTRIHASRLLAITDRCTADSVIVMIEHAKARGWLDVEITGGTSEWREAMVAAAIVAGIRVVNGPVSGHSPSTPDLMPDMEAGETPAPQGFR